MDTTIKPPNIPSEPPDNNPMDEDNNLSHSYKEMLLDKQETTQTQYYEDEPCTHKGEEKGKDNLGLITLSQDDKNHLYYPWRFSVIIKSFGCRMSHHFLRSKLIDLWNHFELLILIDLGWDFFIAKFGKEENAIKALHQGPWFLFGNFLLVRKWKPKFVPQEVTLSFTAIWVRLLQLPTELYDKEILEKVGRKLGKLLKIDMCTSATLRGRYARIMHPSPNRNIGGNIHHNWGS